jgi:hypothetical protein
MGVTRRRADVQAPPIRRQARHSRLPVSPVAGCPAPCAASAAPHRVPRGWTFRLPSSPTLVVLQAIRRQLVSEGRMTDVTGPDAVAARRREAAGLQDRHGEDREARERFRPEVRRPVNAKDRPSPCPRTLRSATRRVARRARGASEGEDASGCSSGDCLRGEPCLARFGSLRSASWNAPPLHAPDVGHRREPRPSSDLFPDQRRWRARGRGVDKARVAARGPGRRRNRRCRARPSPVSRCAARARSVPWTQALFPRSYPRSHSQASPRMVRWAFSGTGTPAQRSPSRR